MELVLTSFPEFLLTLIPDGLLLWIIFRKSRSSAFIFSFMVLSLAIGSAVIFFIDLKIPSSESSFRSNGNVVPLWLAFAAWSAKSLFIGAMIFGVHALKKSKIPKED